MNPLRRTGVLIVSDALHVGGAERVSVDIANTLDRDEFHVHYCATRVGGPLERSLAPDVGLTVLGRAATWDLAKLWPFARLVQRKGIDVIHSHGRGTMKFVALAKSLGLIDTPHVFHDHFGWLHIDRGASWGLRTAMRRGVDAYIGVDQRLCEWARERIGMPADRVHLIRSGIDLARFDDARPAGLRAQLRLGPDDVLLMMAANIRPQKDHPTLLRAMASLPDGLRARVHLAVAGSTDADSDYHAGCVDMIERLGLEQQVHLLGERDDVPSLLAEADAAVLSSKNETGPLVILEYMAAGVPFVATDTGEIAAAVRDLGVGFIVSPRDHHEFADGLRRLLGLSVTERAEMGVNGRRIVAERFSQTLATEQVAATYRAVLHQGASVPATASPSSGPAAT